MHSGSRKIIGIVGPIGSGKDTVAKYLEEKGYVHVSYADIIREAMRKEGIETTRENLQQYATKQRQEKGEDVFTRMVIEKAESSGDRTVISGIRTAGDVKPLMKKFGDSLKIIKVVAWEGVRFQRLKNRGWPQDPKTVEEFRKHEKGETERGMTKAFQYADIAVFNNGTLEELHQQIDTALEKLKNKIDLKSRSLF